MIWRKLNGQILKGPISRAVEEAIQREQSAGHKLKVCIGTDSQIKTGHVEFATVIVFLREKRGGFLYRAQERTPRHRSLKERMLREVSYSIGIAYELCDLFRRYKVDL